MPKVHSAVEGSFKIIVIPNEGRGCIAHRSTNNSKLTCACATCDEENTGAGNTKDSKLNYRASAIFELYHIRNISKLLLMVKFIPNILTFTRFVLTFVFLGMILYSPSAANRPFFLDIAFVLFVIAELTDIVDGRIARKFKVSSKLGRMTDPLADKILVCGSFVCFAIIGQPTLLKNKGRLRMS